VFPLASIADGWPENWVMRELIWGKFKFILLYKVLNNAAAQMSSK